MLNVSPVEDGAESVDTMAIAVLNSSPMFSFSNITFMSVLSCGNLGTCIIPYQMLSSASSRILSMMSVAPVLKYSLSDKNCSCCLCCCGQMKCSAILS